MIMYFLYNYHVESNFNKYSGIANLKEDTPNIWNHHQHSAGIQENQLKIQSQSGIKIQSQLVKSIS